MLKPYGKHQKETRQLKKKIHSKRKWTKGKDSTVVGDHGILVSLDEFFQTSD